MERGPGRNRPSLSSLVGPSQLINLRVSTAYDTGQVSHYLGTRVAHAGIEPTPTVLQTVALPFELKSLVTAIPGRARPCSTV